MGKHQTGKLVGLSGNVLVKSNISKSKFDNVLDIREDFSLNIQNMRKIHLLGFSIQRLWEKSWSIIFKIKVMHAYDLGLTPLIHFGLKYIFV